MSNTENIKKEKSGNGARPIHYLLLLSCFAVLAAGLIAAATSNKNQKQQLAFDEQALIDSLHVFPEIEFADSLYASVTTAKYDNDSETPKDVYYYAVDSTGNPTDEIVHETHYYENEHKFIDGNVSNKKREGLWYAYYPDGTVQTMAVYKNGLEEGRYAVYYPNGNVRYTGLYKAGKEVGEWRFYNEDGTLAKTVKH